MTERAFDVYINPETQGCDLDAIVAQLVPMIVSALANGKLKVHGCTDGFDWRKAVPTNRVHESMAPIDPATMAHFIAIQRLLTKPELAFAREVAAQLEPAEICAWIELLARLAVPDAVTKIRRHLLEIRKAGCVVISRRCCTPTR